MLHPDHGPWILHHHLSRGAMIGFLRHRNAQGCDVCIRPYADRQDTDCILLDLDTAAPSTLERVRAHAHAPCLWEGWQDSSELKGR